MLYSGQVCRAFYVCVDQATSFRGSFLNVIISTFLCFIYTETSFV